MKKTLRMLIYCLCSLVILNMPMSAYADGDDDNDPIEPPIRPSSEAASVQCTTSSIEVIFFDDADAVVEVEAENGATVYYTFAEVARYSKMTVRASGWHKGWYTIKVRMNGRLIKLENINVN